MYLEKAKAKEEDLHQVGIANFTPCTTWQVTTLENWYGHSLPQAYKEFLFWMGSWGGGFLMGSECFYGDLKDIQLWARELLAENRFSGTLPENAFIFWMHQGYQFAFFLCHEGENPPVYYYLEEEPVKTSFIQIYHFSEFLAQQIDDHLKIAHYNAGLRAKLAQSNPEKAREMEKEEIARRETLTKLSK